jgi:hypothetical protein
MSPRRGIYPVKTRWVRTGTLLQGGARTNNRDISPSRRKKSCSQPHDHTLLRGRHLKRLVSDVLMRIPAYCSVSILCHQCLEGHWWLCPRLKGQRHQEIMDFLEIWSHHGCEEEEEGRESVGSRVCPRTILERGAARGIARLPPCTNAARGTREKHVLIRNQSLSGVSLLDCWTALHSTWKLPLLCTVEKCRASDVENPPLRGKKKFRAGSVN